ncbi:MAG TPA: substrate-binding domain-containing protein [Aggregatilineales bacterium]|nr:substrate-binding domain-containing protein [Aggregatilineales bacterium]
MRRFFSELIIIGLLCLGALRSAPVSAQETGWNAYDPAQVDGKVIIDSNPDGPLPPNCPIPAPKSRYIIGMSQANRAEPWRELMDKNIADAAEEHPELAVVFTDARQDNAKQISDVRTFLTLKVDLLIISPNEATPLTDVIREAYQKCVPVIVLDRAANGDQFTMFIGANNVAIGQAAGRYVARWCDAQHRVPCNIIELRGLEGSPPARDRGDGFRDGIKADPNARIVGSQNADWLRELALDRAATLFQENPHVDVVYAHNDPMAEAAIVAAQNAKLDIGKILFVGIDGLPTAEGGIMSVLQKRLGVTYIYPSGGRQAINWAVQILVHHVNPPRKIELSFDEVRADNGQAICNTYACPQATQRP